MPYIVDRGRALYGKHIVAIVAIRQRQRRSRIILEDGSLYQTLTRPVTFARALSQRREAVVRIGARTSRATRRRSPPEMSKPNEGAAWLTPP